MTDWKPLVVVLAGCAGLSALAAPSWAQLSPADGPVNASAIHSHMETDKQTGYDVLYLDDRVEILQDDRRLRCDHAKIIEAPRADGQGGKTVVQMEATGNVFYIVYGQTVDGVTTDDQIAHGDYGIYTKADDTMKMTGNVIMRRGQSVATGNLLIDHVHPGLMSLVSDADSANHGRVHAIMYPQKKAPAGPPPASQTKPPAK